ncbi:MAG: class I SAM-dependent methyltransferase [Acidimicrobiales bacterium]
MSATVLGFLPFAAAVRLRSIDVSEPVAAVRRRYEAAFGVDPEDRGGWYHDDDWRRISFVLDRVGSGERLLDVGTGAGQFVNAVAQSGRFAEIHGADPHRFSKYLDLFDAVNAVRVGIDKLPFPDDHFDVVTCMEVLEHVPAPVLEAGMAELRRVCRGKLIMSVPFAEPEPIYEGHQRRFGVNDVARTFPEGERTLLYRLITPWVVVEEWTGSSGRGAPAPQSRPRTSAVVAAVAGLTSLVVSRAVTASQRVRGRTSRQVDS